MLVVFFVADDDLISKSWLEGFTKPSKSSGSYRSPSPPCCHLEVRLLLAPLFLSWFVGLEEVS